jgi:hypothetical protein
MRYYDETLQENIIRQVNSGDLAICDLDPADFGYDDLGSGLFNTDTEMTWEQFLSDEFGY